MPQSRITLTAARPAYGVEGTLMDPAEYALFAQMFTTELRRRLNGLRVTIQETGRLVAPLVVQLDQGRVRGVGADQREQRRGGQPRSIAAWESQCRATSSMAPTQPLTPDCRKSSMPSR